MSSGLHGLSFQVDSQMKSFLEMIVQTCELLILNGKYPLAEKVKELKLLSYEDIVHFKNILKFLQIEEKLVLDEKESMKLYTMLDLTGRCYLCEVGDDVKNFAINFNGLTEERFTEVRDMNLMLLENFVTEIKSVFESNPRFQELLEKLSLLDN